MMKGMIWLLAVVILVACAAPVCAADEAKKNIPLYDGKPGTKIGDVCINPKDFAEMVWVATGPFYMGLRESQLKVALADCWNWPGYPLALSVYWLYSMPVRRVEMDGFWTYKLEVTIRQYRHFCIATGRAMPELPYQDRKDDLPITNITWNDASDYAAWAACRLPTEAEWEKAARGVQERAYPWGMTWKSDSDCANGMSRKTGTTAAPSPVGHFPTDASIYGCLDMAGNVREWCNDLYGLEYYEHGPAKNPLGPAASNTLTPERVVRGGSFDDDRRLFFHCACRRSESPNKRDLTIGFRCARTPLHTATSGSEKDLACDIVCKLMYIARTRARSTDVTPAMRQFVASKPSPVSKAVRRDRL